MTQQIALGDGLSLPAEIAGRRSAVFGLSGSGKSNTATVIIEALLHADEQIVLIDPKGEGWGLLSLANGKPSNLPVIVFGEPNGHIESLAESHGPRLADFVVETGRSVVLSLLGFESDQSERRFVATFLRQLYRRKSRQPHPTRTLVVLEEAHLFVPENVRGDAAELAGAVQRIVRQGRSFGIGSLLVDQRPQDVSKRVISQCDTLICHQLGHKTDRDALTDWVRGYDVDGRGKEFLESLASLEPGQAWVWSPAWLKVFRRVKVRRRKTFDSGAAPDGSESARTVQRAEVDLDALRGQLAEVVEKAKADDPKELRKRIADLERQLKGRAADPQAVESAVAAAVAQRDREWQMRLAEVEKVTHSFVGRLRKIEELAHVNGEATTIPAVPTARPLHRPAGVHGPVGRPAGRETAARAAADPRGASTAEGPAVIGRSGLKYRMMVALCQFPDGLTKKRLAALAGGSPDGGGFGARLSELRKAGYATDGEPILATAEGVAAVGSFDPLPTGEALIDYWRRRIGGGVKRAIFDTLVEAYPNAMTKDAVADAIGASPTGGGFGARLSELRSLGLVEGSGSLRASEELF